MPRATFPAIPTIETGQVFSAAVLRHGHAAAINYLFGESHASWPLAHTRTPSTDVYQSEYTTIWELWGLHASQTLYYRLMIKVNYGNASDRTWAYCVQVSPDDGTTWYTAFSESGTQNTYQLKENVVNLAAVNDGAGGTIADHLSLGQVYRWRLQVAVTDQPDPADCTVHCIPWALGTRKSVAGWVTPPTFTASTSNPAHANTLASDAQALYDALPPGEAALSFPSLHTIIFASTWEELTRAVYRYRPNQLYVAVLGSAWSDETWQWRVKVETDSASAVVYTSGAIAGDEATELSEYSWDNAQLIDLTTGDAATALAAASITLTLGEWYRVVVEVYSTADPGRAWAVGAAVYRVSSGAAGEGYTVPHLWTHGDQDVGPTYLNQYSASLTALYSGAERLHVDTAAVDVVENGNGHALQHRRRYLRYRGVDQVRIYYGADMGQTYDPPASATWTALDLDSVGLPYGGIYWVTGAEACMEADSA